MAATGTARPAHRIARNRLPLTSCTMSSRRGSHEVTAAAFLVPESRVTSATHITPNVGIIARGDIRSAGRARTTSRTPQMAATNLRRLHA